MTSNYAVSRNEIRVKVEIVCHATAHPSMNIYDGPTDRGRCGPRKLLCCASLFGGGGEGRKGSKEGKKENDGCSTVQRSLSEKKKEKKGEGIEIAFDGLFLTSLLFFSFDTFACN